MKTILDCFGRGVRLTDGGSLIDSGEEIENYPQDTLFPSALPLGWRGNEPIHVVVALNSKRQQGYVITVYRPDLEHFYSDFKTRRTP